MNENEFATFETAYKSTVRRISAENTWLRHSLMELKIRLNEMNVQLSAIAKHAKALRKSLLVKNPEPTIEPKTETRK